MWRWMLEYTNEDGEKKCIISTSCFSTPELARENLQENWNDVLKCLHDLKAVSFEKPQLAIVTAKEYTD